MRRLLLLALCLLCAAPCALAQEETLYAWTLQVGDSGFASPQAMALAMDDSLYVAGNIRGEDSSMGENLGERDGFILRVDMDGTLLWARRLGGSGDDMFTHVIALSDGGCVAMGTTSSSDGDIRGFRGGVDAWMVRLDAQGELLWTKCLGGTLDDELAVLRAEEGLLFVCGRSMSRNGDLRANYGSWDAWAAAVDPETGKLAWSYRYGFSGDDAFTTAYPVYEGWLLLGEASEEVILSGDEARYASRPIVQMLSVDGTPQWETPVTLGDTSGTSRLLAIAETDTGWMLAGETNSRFALMPMPHGGMDIWVLHMRSSGTIAWQRTYGGNNDEALHSIQRLASGDYLLLGETKSSDGQVFGAHGSRDLWLLRISSSGLIRWQQPLGGSGISTASALLQSEEGALLVAGTTTSQDGDIGRHDSLRTGFLSQLAPNGNVLAVHTVTDGLACTLIDMQAQAGQAYLLGSVRSIDASGPVESVWLSKLALDGYWGE